MDKDTISGHHPNWRGRCTVTKLYWLCMESNHRLRFWKKQEMLSEVRGTVIPWDQGPRLVCRGRSFSPRGFGPLYKQDSIICSIF